MIEVSIMRPGSRVVTWTVGIFTLANAWGSGPIGSVTAREESRPAESHAGRRGPAEVNGYAPITSTANYFRLAGYYSTSTGVVWVPAPGYYHVGPPTQYFRYGSYRPPVGWGRAHPAPSPTPSVKPPVRPDPSAIRTDYYWHPRAMAPTEEHEAWIRGQLRAKSGPGRRN